MKNRLGKQWKLCPWCGVSGRNISLRESHVIFMCRANRVEQHVEGVAKYLEDKLIPNTAGVPGAGGSFE